MSAITLEQITKRYQTVTALDRIDLHVEPGTFFVLLGPNGAGKTTALKILACLVHPSEGEVQLPPKEQVTYVPDFPYLYEKLTPMEFLEFVAGVYRIAQPQEAIAQWSDALEVPTGQDKLIEHLSHGQRQRVVFAAAFLPKPRLMLVDEPMVGLDPRMRRKVSDLLKQRTKEGGIVVMSTHTLALADELADQIAVLDKGRVVACGSAEDLARQADTDGGKIEEVFFKLTQGAKHPASS